MTLAEFRKKHPRCKVGYPSPTFPLVMMLFCAGVVIILLRYLLHLARQFPDLEDASDYFAAFGGVTLSFSFSVGVYATAKRLGEVLDWARKGRVCFAVADDEALIVDEAGESVVLPLSGVTKLDLSMNRLEIKMKENYPQSDALYLMLIRVFNPGGDGPGASAFFNALAPRVKQLAPQPEVTRKEISLFGP